MDNVRMSLINDANGVVNAFNIHLNDDTEVIVNEARNTITFKDDLGVVAKITKSYAFENVRLQLRDRYDGEDRKVSDIVEKDRHIPIEKYPILRPFVMAHPGIKYDTFIYHANCVDGLVAMAIAKQEIAQATNEGYECIPADYSKPLIPEEFAGKSVCFLDFSCKKDVMAQILEVAKHVTVIDHHIGVYDELCELEHLDNFTYVYRSDQSGAQLAWEYFTNRYEPYFISLVGDRDLWTKRYNNSDILNLAIRVSKHGLKEADEHIAQIIHQDVTYIDDYTCELIKLGKSCMVYHSYLVAQIAEFAYPITLSDGTEVLAVNCPLGMMSDVGALLAKTNVSGVVLLSFETQDQIKYSLRVSDESNYDASSYAKSKGGGGHIKAAGWSTRK